MFAETDMKDTFNGWQFIANLGALVVLALLPYLIWIGVLIFG